MNILDSNSCSAPQKKGKITLNGVINDRTLVEIFLSIVMKKKEIQTEQSSYYLGHKRA